MKESPINVSSKVIHISLRLRDECLVTKKNLTLLFSVSLSSDPSYQYQTALNQMGAMGFDNEGGWLTSLLDAKGGDIVRVLDAIKIGNQPSFSGNSK